MASWVGAALNSGVDLTHLQQEAEVISEVVRFDRQITRLVSGDPYENDRERLRASADKIFESDVLFCLRIARYQDGG